MNDIEKLAVDFCNGKYDYSVKDEVWPQIFEYLSNNIHKVSFDKPRIHTLWTVNGGHLRRKVSDDKLLLSILLKSLPSYSGNALTLYRGECQFLYDENKVGFCWTPDINVAKKFAKGLNAIESGGVLLKAHASTEAILSAPNDHSINQMEEIEYTCNPELLDNVEVIEYYEKFT